MIVAPRRRAVWGEHRHRALLEYEDLALLASEGGSSVVFFGYSDDLRHFSDRCGARDGIHLHEFEGDDGWVRDNGPFTLVQDDEVLFVDFKFNSWGGRFLPCERDDGFSRWLAQTWDVSYERVDFVLEGGAIALDGQGTALVVEESALAPSRNGELSRLDFESVVGPALGIQKFLWLPYGLVEDLKNTDGHVDNVAAFLAPGHVLLQSTDVDDVNFERLRENAGRLSSATDANGRPLVIDFVNLLPRVHIPGVGQQPAPYLNYVRCARRIILPSVDPGMDPYAESVFRGLFPTLDICFTKAWAMTYGGGGPHCVSLNTL